MDLLNILFGLISIISFGFALWEYHKSQIQKQTEKRTVEEYDQKLYSANGYTVSTLYNIDMIIRKADENGIRISELQDLARVARGQLYILKLMLKKERATFGEYRYGKMIQSSRVTSDKNTE